LHVGIVIQHLCLLKANRHSIKKKVLITSRKDALHAGQRKKSSNSGEAEADIKRYVQITNPDIIGVCVFIGVMQAPAAKLPWCRLLLVL